MKPDLPLYHKILAQLCQWLPKERITRKRNLAWLIYGLCMGGGIHTSQVVRTWPVKSTLPSMVNRMRRFLSNSALDVRTWYGPQAEQLLAMWAGDRLRLVIDSTKVGFCFRLLCVGVAYRKRTLPLVWSVHWGSRGHTNVNDQLALLQRIQGIMPKRTQVWQTGETSHSLRLCAVATLR